MKAKSAQKLDLIGLKSFGRGSLSLCIANDNNDTVITLPITDLPEIMDYYTQNVGAINFATFQTANENYPEMSERAVRMVFNNDNDNNTVTIEYKQAKKGMNLEPKDKNIDNDKSATFIVDRDMLQPFYQIAVITLTNIDKIDGIYQKRMKNKKSRVKFK